MEKVTRSKKGWTPQTWCNDSIDFKAIKAYNTKVNKITTEK